jgi:hypothetical protein
VQNYPSDETDDGIKEKDKRERHDNISALYLLIRHTISYVNCANGLTESIIGPSPPTSKAGLSTSALHLNITTTVDTMENEEKRMATNAATRGILSRPGKDRKVIHALKRIAAFHNRDELRSSIPIQRNVLTMKQGQAIITNMGAELCRPLSSSSRW